MQCLFLLMRGGLQMRMTSLLRTVGPRFYSAMKNAPSAQSSPWLALAFTGLSVAQRSLCSQALIAGKMRSCLARRCLRLISLQTMTPRFFIPVVRLVAPKVQSVRIGQSFRPYSGSLVGQQFKTCAIQKIRRIQRGSPHHSSWSSRSFMSQDAFQ